MLGFIKKDLLLIKGNLRVILIVLVTFCFMMLNDMSSITFILPFMCVMICISTFSYDDYNKWDAYALTFPNGRNNIVKSKYVSTLIVVVISTIITSLVTMGITYFKGTLNLTEIFQTLIGGIVGIIIVMSIMYPFLYKYGVEKGRNVIFIGVFIMAFIGGLIIKQLGKINLDIEYIVNFIDNYWLLLSAILMITMLSISYFISKRIYLKKEF